MGIILLTLGMTDKIRRRTKGIELSQKNRTVPIFTIFHPLRSFSNERDRHRLLNLLKMLIQSENGAGVLLGDHGNIAVQKMDRFSSVLELSGEFSRLQPGILTLIQDREGIKEILDRRNLPFGFGALDEFGQNDLGDADLSPRKQPVNFFGDDRRSSPEITDPNRRIHQDSLSAHDVFLRRSRGRSPASL